MCVSRSADSLPRGRRSRRRSLRAAQAAAVLEDGDKDEAAFQNRLLGYSGPQMPATRSEGRSGSITRKVTSAKGRVLPWERQLKDQGLPDKSTPILCCPKTIDLERPARSVSPKLRGLRGRFVSDLRAGVEPGLPPEVLEQLFSPVRARYEPDPSYPGRMMLSSTHFRHAMGSW